MLALGLFLLGTHDAQLESSPRLVYTHGNQLDMDPRYHAPFGLAV